MAHKAHVANSPSVFHMLAYKVLGQFPARALPLTNWVRRMLVKAYIDINYMVYVSSMLFWSTLTSIVSAVAAFLLSRFMLTSLGLFLRPDQLLFLSVILGILCGIISLVCFLYYPKYVASNLKMMIEKNLVYIVNYMAILSNAGATPWQIFFSLMDVGRIYGVEKIARSIVKNVEILGFDVVTAIDEEGKRVPSKELADLLQGYIFTIRTGGDPRKYLSIMAERFMDLRRRLMTRLIDQLTLMQEVMIMILIALPVMLVTMLSIMGLIGGAVIAGLTAHHLMMLTAYILVPFGALAVLIILDAMLSGW